MFRSRKIHLIGESKERRSRVFSAFRFRLCGANGVECINGEDTAETGESAAEEARNAKRRQRDEELNR